jgi:hypothetical protein
LPDGKDETTAPDTEGGIDDGEFDQALERARRMTPAQIARIRAADRKRRRDERRLDALCLKRALSPAEPQAAIFACPFALIQLAGHADELNELPDQPFHRD